jgi:hypothetical protein
MNTMLYIISCLLLAWIGGRSLRNLHSGHAERTMTVSGFGIKDILSCRSVRIEIILLDKKEHSVTVSVKDNTVFFNNRYVATFDFDKDFSEVRISLRGESPCTCRECAQVLDKLISALPVG